MSILFKHGKATMELLGSADDVIDTTLEKVLKHTKERSHQLHKPHRVLGNIISSLVMRRKNFVFAMKRGKSAGSFIKVPAENFKAAVTAAVKFFMPWDERDLKDIGGLEDPHEADLMVKYAKLPYDTMVLDGLYKSFLLTKTKSGFTSRAVGVDGEVELQTTHFVVSENDIEIINTPTNDELIEYIMPYLPPENVEVARLQYAFSDHLLAGFILRSLLFINAKNTTFKEIKATKKQFPNVPPQMLPKYDYRIVDIDRQYTTAVSTKDVLDILNDETTRSTSRASFVRGHFKQRKTGLFWWNMHLRNSRNIDTGFVDKDYRVL